MPLLASILWGIICIILCFGILYVLSPIFTYFALLLLENSIKEFEIITPDDFKIRWDSVLGCHVHDYCKFKFLGRKYYVIICSQYSKKFSETTRKQIERTTNLSTDVIIKNYNQYYDLFNGQELSQFLTKILNNTQRKYYYDNLQKEKQNEAKKYFDLLLEEDFEHTIKKLNK